MSQDFGFLMGHGKKKKLPDLDKLLEEAANNVPLEVSNKNLSAHVNGQAQRPPMIGDKKMEHKNTKHSGDKVAEIFQTLEHARGKRLLICIKGFPDPDNIGSALALKWMAANYDIKSTILYFEQISHQENRALVKKLDIDLEEWDEGFDVSRFDYFAVNDSQNIDLPISTTEMKLLVFVDHHKVLGSIQGQFVDIRESAGSTSAIYAEYLQQGPLRFDRGSEEELKIATALMHGIRTDTDNFVNANEIDYRASEFLSSLVDKDLLSLISRQLIPAKTMDLTQIALQRKDIRGTFMFSGVGFVREEDRDGIGQCSDYLLHREGIDTVIVYGVVANEFVDGSLRTKSHTLDPDKWIKDVFGHDKDGKYYGGGRKDKGGFQIPLGVFAKCKDKDLLWVLIKKTIDDLFFDKIGVEGQSANDLDINGPK
jgi:nanoRNase/pAp phosphatase (c-di-AMP/oligoRNAs hydrolase)